MVNRKSTGGRDMNTDKQAIAVTLLVFALIMAASGVVSAQTTPAALVAYCAPVVYANVDKPGGNIVVLPSELKSDNAVFKQQVSAGDIAAFASSELAKDHFTVLSLSDLGLSPEPVVQTLTKGDKTALANLMTGPLSSVQYLLKFDLLKAERVGEPKKRFGGALGVVVGTPIPAATSSVPDTWTVGIRYIVFDASTGEKVASNYFQLRMQLGPLDASSLAAEVTPSPNNVTLQSMVQRIIQRCVVDLDAHK